MSKQQRAHNTVRTFVAIDISAELRKACQQLLAQVSQLPGQVKWVRPESLHITLKFLGHIPETQVTAIQETLIPVVQSVPSFTLESTSLGGFPSVERPRVIWLGINGKGISHLQTLQQRIDEALAALGFPTENRPFRPHLTLGRVKAPFNLPTIVKTLLAHQFPPIAFPVTEVILMRSQLQRNGARYTPLVHIPLKNNGE